MYIYITYISIYIIYLEYTEPANTVSPTAMIVKPVTIPELYQAILNILHELLRLTYIYESKLSVT